MPSVGRAVPLLKSKTVATDFSRFGPASADAEHKREVLREREALRAPAARLTEEGEAATNAAVEGLAPPQWRRWRRRRGGSQHGKAVLSFMAIQDVGAARQGGGGVGALMLPKRKK
jgi:hypothetical protein